MTVDAYLEALSPKDKDQLEHIRKLVKIHYPEAEEVISYGIPGFKLKGAYLCGYAAFKDHLSFFPTSAPIVLLQSELKEYKLSKGTIQFTNISPLPDNLIIKLTGIRAAAINSD